MEVVLFLLSVVRKAVAAGGVSGAVKSFHDSPHRQRIPELRGALAHQCPFYPYHPIAPGPLSLPAQTNALQIFLVPQ